MTRALVTGVTGQDGGYLAELLLARGVRVVGTTSRDDGPAIAGVDLRRVDLRSTAEVDGLVADCRPDLVVNLAAVSSVARSWAEPETTFDVNGQGFLRLLEAVRRHAPGARVLQASSAEMFADSDEPLTETSPLGPSNPYGASKAAAHHIAHVHRARGLWVSTAILFNHESPRRPHTFVSRKITAGVAAIARGGTAPLVLGNLEARRDWGDARDVVDAMDRIVRHDEPDDFVVATGETHSVAEVVSVAFAHVGIDDWRDHVTTDPDLIRPTDVATRRGDATKAVSVLGWSPRWSFSDTIADMVRADLADS